MELIVRRALAGFDRISPAEAADTYVVSFWVNDHEDDPTLPVLRVGTNTETNASASAPRASSADEARWNFAFWLHNDLATVGGPDDPEGRHAIDALFSELGLQFADDDSPSSYAVGDQMTSAFVSCCIEAARRLHDHEGFHRRFGRDLPILVHELEYYELIVEQNRRCNPPELVAPFAAWVASF